MASRPGVGIRQLDGLLVPVRVHILVLHPAADTE